MQGRVTNKYSYSYSAHNYDNMKKVNRNDNVTPLEPKPKDDSIAAVLQEMMKQLAIMNTNTSNLASLSSRITPLPNPGSIPLNVPL